MTAVPRQNIQLIQRAIFVLFCAFAGYLCRLPYPFFFLSVIASFAVCFCAFFPFHFYPNCTSLIPTDAVHGSECSLCRWALRVPVDDRCANGRCACQWAFVVPMGAARVNGRSLCQWALRVSKGTSLVRDLFSGNIHVVVLAHDQF